MLGDIHAHLLIAVALVFMAPLAAVCRAENDLSLVRLPEWKESSDYVSRCFYRQHGNLTCDWTSSQRMGDIRVNILVSHPLTITGMACLEFWHLASGALSGTTLRALLKTNTSEVEVWTYTPLPTNAWRQVSVPLNITEMDSKVIFEAVHPLSVEQTTVKLIGVRRGSCRNQCDSNAELWTGDSTRCLCSVGQLVCFQSLCPKGHNCTSRRDGSSSNSLSGMCTIHSNTDCQTFDGVMFRFMSPCTYVLAKTCSTSETLPQFNLEVVNVKSGNESMPTIQQVNINLGNLRVSILKRQTHWAVVNGVWRELPLSLNDGTINIKGNPASVIVGSSSGVSVSFDNTGAVQVRVPLQYSDRVCGLCGNFNQLPGDDLLKPDGTMAESATALAESWQTGGNVSCETIKVPQQCDPLGEAYYSNENYCGLLRAGSGPFTSCIPIVGAESYFRACLLGLCSSNGDQNVLCEILKAYADVCLEAGIGIPTWRNSTFCSLQCGKNSHYTSCANSCPEVCSSLDQTSSCGSCEERCECNPGFKLSGDKCVPAEFCGCWYQGKYFERGGTTVEGDCIQQCQCIDNGVMQCTEMECAIDEVCKDKNGIKGCFPFKPATCSVYGDPHYITFDKLAYSFQGGCPYTLTTTCGRHSSVNFNITGFNIHPTGQNFTRSKLDAVLLQLHGLDLTLKQSGEVDVHGISVILPYSTNGSYGSLWVHVKKDYIILETTFGLKLWLDQHSRLFLQVDERYKYELCGLCGTYSGYQEDDFVMPGGQIASGLFEFGDSWRIHTNGTCAANPNDPRKCVDNENTANEECSMVFQGPFEACHDHVHPSIYFSSCVYDYCDSSGDRATLCESLKSYATACEVEGVELSHWQNGTSCDFSTVTPTTSAGLTNYPEQTFCPISCSFDINLCGWEQLIQDSFDWTRHSGSTPSNLTGPNKDHTTGDGFYMYLEGDRVIYGDSARMLSPLCQLNGPVCFHFWYHMYGSATHMALNVYQLQGNNATKIWSMMNNQGPEWLLGKAEIKLSGPFKFIIEGIRGSTAQSDVAIDDVAITSGSCSDTFPTLAGITLPVKTTEVAPSHQICNLDCSFKNGLCTWEQMVTDAFDWTRNNGSTPTEMTGPSSDYTGDGHYLYIETKSVTHGDTARLISAKCAETGPQCLQFWYLMYRSADTMGLNIYIFQNKVPEVVWWKRNNQGNVWHLAQVDLNATVTFQVIFEGRQGSNQSDVAIDDVTLRHGRCSDLSSMVTGFPVEPEFNTSIPNVNLLTTAAPQAPVGNVTMARSVNLQTTVAPKPPVQNGTAHVPTLNGTVPPTAQLMTASVMQNGTISSGQAQNPVCQLDCDFEQDYCQWRQMLTDVFGWERRNGSTLNLTTGPLSDHTKRDGHYLYIEANRASHGDAAGLTSVECSDTGPKCLTFWYHMYGSADRMGLVVYILKDNLATVLWRKRNDQGNLWHIAQVDLMINGTFQIIFEGRRGTSDESDVAIDDIKLIHGVCQDLVSPVTVPPATHGTINVPEVPSATRPASSNHPQTGPTSTPTSSLLPPTTHANATPGPQGPATTRPASSNETGQVATTTAGLLPPTTHANATPGPHVPATTKPATSNETGEVAITSAGQLPSTTHGNVTLGPQVPATTKQTTSKETGQVATTTAGPLPPTTHANATPGPQVPATTNSALSNETGPMSTPTGSLLPPTTHANTTAVPQVPATTRPASSNETGQVATTTARQFPPTTHANATVGPQVLATTIPASSNETEEVAITSAGPLPPTTHANATPGPQVSATTRPAPSNETGPMATPTTGLLPPIAHGNATVGPQAPVTNKQKPETMRPQQMVVPQTGANLSTPSCARNSHYSTCIPACNPTCRNLNGPPHCSAEKNCMSGCVCDDGFVQKGSICVPIQKCGCVDRNATIHHFSEVWYSNHCLQKCECEDDDGEGKVECEDKNGCEGDAVCLQLDEGKYYCQSTDFGKCTIQGDPQYGTFDKLKHDFSGTNLYVLVRTKNLPKNLPEIYIEGTNVCQSGESSEEDRSSTSDDDDDDDDDDDIDYKILQQLKIKVYNHTVELNHRKKVFVDGQRIKVPGSSAPGFEITMHSSHIYLKTDFGLSVEFSGHCKTDIILPFLYKRRVEGLCGNFDGRKANDKMKPDGSIAKNTLEFGESWRVENE